MKKNTRQWFWHYLALAVGLCIIALWLSKVEFGKVVQAMKQCDPHWGLTAIAAYGGAWALRTWRLKSILGHLLSKKPTFMALFRIYIAGLGLNVIFPAKLGDLAMMFFLKTRGVVFGQALAVVLHMRILDLAAVLTLLFPAVFMVGFRFVPEWIRILYAAGLVGLVGIISVVVFDRHQRLLNIFGILERCQRVPGLPYLGRKIAEAYQVYRSLVMAPGTVWITVALSLSVWVFEGLVTLMLVNAFHLSLPWYAAFVAVAVGNLAKTIPLTPGGIGIYESGFTAILLLFSLPLDFAVLLAVADMVIKKGINITVGLPCAWQQGLLLADMRRLRRTEGNRGY